MLAATIENTSRVERRLGRPKHEPIPLEVMRRTEGRPLTPRQLADLAGMSDDKVRTLLHIGFIKGNRIPSAGGARFQWQIPYAEAQRILIELRVLA